jgi:hypothetical protein
MEDTKLWLRNKCGAIEMKNTILGRLNLEFGSAKTNIYLLLACATLLWLSIAIARRARMRHTSRAHSPDLEKPATSKTSEREPGGAQ